MRKPIYHAFRAANVEEALAAEAAASIPDDVVSWEELLEAVNKSETKFDAVRDATTDVTARNEAAIAKSADEFKVALDESTEEFKAALAKSTEEFKAALAKSTEELKADLAKLEAALNKSIEEFKADLATANASFKVEMIWWLFAINIAFASTIIGVLKLL